MTDFKNIIYEKREDGVAVVTINRSERLNAMDPPTNAEMAQARRDFALDPKMRVLILTGTGDKAFSTGMDLKAAAERARVAGTVDPRINQPPAPAPVKDSKPTIAAINGYAIAAGLETALRCDIRIAADHARFGMMEAKRGLVPETGCLYLPKVVGFGNASYMLLTGDLIDAQEALRWGLVSKVVPLKELMPTALRIAQTIASNAPLAVQYIKRSLAMRRESPLAESQMYAELITERIFASEDVKEGARAFAEKRPPVYEGR
jgi:enoyl-CoA hydratase/carnithine racemase